ncbi:hypothetical protein EfmJHP9_22210 [Enterococcus faecium]|nr:hypothetical protein EfmJHP9_22210 [Enterococcus faecium]
MHELEEIRGIGRVKAIEIKALIELGRRIQTDHERAAPPVRTSYELAQQLILEMKDHKQEHLVCIEISFLVRVPAQAFLYKNHLTELARWFCCYHTITLPIT